MHTQAQHFVRIAVVSAAGPPFGVLNTAFRTPCRLVRLTQRGVFHVIPLETCTIEYDNDCGSSPEMRELLVDPHH